MELKPSQKSQDRESEIVKDLFDVRYEFYMHRKWMGPKDKVEQKYDEWQELNEMHGENIMFRLKT